MWSVKSSKSGWLLGSNNHPNLEADLTCLTQHNQEITQQPPDPLHREKVGSGLETNDGLSLFSLQALSKDPMCSMCRSVAHLFSYNTTNRFVQDPWHSCFLNADILDSELTNRWPSVSFTYCPLTLPAHTWLLCKPNYILCCLYSILVRTQS